MEKPSIFDFLDAAHFLNSYYEWKKHLDKNFSITKWAEEMGMQKVTLRFVLRRQRVISPRTVLVLESNLRMNDHEKEYFSILVAYSQAKSVTQKNALGASLVKLQRSQFVQKPVNSVNISTNAFISVILTLLTFDDIKKDAPTIANLLNIDEASTANILKDLCEEGLVLKNDDGTFNFTQFNFRIPDSPDLRKFYEYWIDRSKAALDLPYDVRRYRSLKFALSADEFNDVVQKMNEYSLSLLSQYRSPALNKRRLYMYETAIFPITKETDN